MSLTSISPAVLAVWGALILSALIFLFFLVKDYAQAKKENKLEKDASVGKISAVSFLTQFFDTLGIGSFAPMTSSFRILKLVDDRVIPGTLNAAATIPVIMEAIIFIQAVKVEPITLIGMLGSALLGAVVGAGIVAKLEKKMIQIVMSIALFIVAFIMIAGQMNWMPVGGEALGLTGTKLVIGIVANFILGALMMAGVGLYAPCMALVYLLGLSPTVAFPIMMGSCALLMPWGSIRFIKEGAYNRKVTMWFLIPGIIGVAIAAFLVKSMPLYWLKWLVTAVLVYTATTLFLDFKKAKA